jgi:hypothetical protein
MGSCLRSLIYKEDWISTIRGDQYQWTSPRWPKNSGDVNLKEVTRVIINENSSKLKFESIEGKELKGYHFGAACKLRGFIESNFPHIEIEYIESSD